MLVCGGVSVCIFVGLLRFTFLLPNVNILYDDGTCKMEGN